MDQRVRGPSSHVKLGNVVISMVELEKNWLRISATCKELLSSERIPSEEVTVSLLAMCNSLVELLVLDPSALPKELIDGATSGLLHLDDASAEKAPTHQVSPVIQRMKNDLSLLAYSVVKHPPVFISPKVLEIYTKIQANLGRPETLPEVFHLYSHKPLPQQDTMPIKYSKSNPNSISNSIPPAVAELALQTAIDSKQLVAAMDIVESAYTTTSYLRAKFIRKLLLPATGVVAAPMAAYVAASQLAALQSSMDAEMATKVAFAGILAYTFFTGTIGVVAITTANDQMDRVTWAPGVPLRERYMREEERAAIDKISSSWGFKESWRRGEEEGEDWDALREWIGHKGMILDRVELKEGME